MFKLLIGIFASHSIMNRFSAELIRDLKDAFEAYDKDGNGSVPVTELREMLKTIGYNPTDILLENTSILVDNGNGRIDLKEFLDLIDRLETEEKNEKEGVFFFLILNSCKLKIKGIPLNRSIQLSQIAPFQFAFPIFIY